LDKAFWHLDIGARMQQLKNNFEYALQCGFVKPCSSCFIVPIKIFQT
jgi:hypothetical protein